jgi:hypothetical protein
MQGSKYAKWLSWAVSLPILFGLAVCQSLRPATPCSSRRSIQLA